MKFTNWKDVLTKYDIQSITVDRNGSIVVQCQGETIIWTEKTNKPNVRSALVEVGLVEAAVMIDRDGDEIVVGDEFWYDSGFYGLIKGVVLYGAGGDRYYVYLVGFGHIPVRDFYIPEYHTRKLKRIKK